MKTFVIAAHVVTRARFSEVWSEMTLLIPATELNIEYWGQSRARDAANAETKKLGFNGRTKFLGWVTQDRQYITG